MSKETKVLAQALGEIAKDKAKDVAATATDGIMHAIENMDPKYAKETLGTLFPVLSLPVKLLIVLMCMTCVALSGALAFEMRAQPAQFDVYDVAVICSLPLVGILLLCAVPIKSLAYGSAALGAEILHRKIQQSEQLATAVTEEVTDNQPASGMREQTNSEHR